MLRCTVLLLVNQGQVAGGPVTGLTGRVAGPSLIRPSIVSAAMDNAALQEKLNSLLARQMHDEEAAYEPPLRRKWVKAPLSQLSTSQSRRDWFRVMSFNMMTDAWGEGRTTPVAGVQVRIPSFTRGGDIDPDAYCDYRCDGSDELPPFLDPAFRRRHLTDMLRHYDPDVVCLNEVNRTFFNTELWNYVRYLGYGNLYQSSRGARVRALRKGDDPDTPRHQGKISEVEDIGNVVLFHKGRFFPLMMPGRDFSRHFHFAQFAGLRDKVTNMTLYIACLQLTAGNGRSAVAVRLHEARQVLMILDSICRNDSDRAHQSLLVCGDLNNQSDEEPCVELLRDRFFSTYDLVGGPRWTTWHYRDQQQTARYAKYFHMNVQEMHRSDPAHLAQAEVLRHRYPAPSNCGAASKYQLVSESLPVEVPALKETCLPTNVGGTAAADGGSGFSDQLALAKETMNDRGITYNTQDFIFYDPRSLALHQVLDIPDEDQVNHSQLFPNHKLPSHHLPLLIDVSWNEVFPDVGATSLKS